MEYQQSIVCILFPGGVPTMSERGGILSSTLNQRVINNQIFWSKSCSNNRNIVACYA
jgi:hypothetical protein